VKRLFKQRTWLFKINQGDLRVMQQMDKNQYFYQQNFGNKIT